jgi:hypothetical protein
MRVRIAGAPGMQESAHTSPGWRNGRRSGLKIRRWQQREGSTPFPGTIHSARHQLAALSPHEMGLLLE